MAASLSAIRAALATRLATIALPGGGTLRASASMTGDIHPPQAVILPARGPFLAYSETFEQGVAEITLEIVILVSWGDERAAQLLEDGFLSPTGAQSVRAAVAADPKLGGAVDFAIVTEAQDYGLLNWGSTEYLAARLLVTAGTE